MSRDEAQEDIEEREEFDADQLYTEMLEIDPIRDLTFDRTDFEGYGEFDE